MPANFCEAKQPAKKSVWEVVCFNTNGAGDVHLERVVARDREQAILVATMRFAKTVKGFPEADMEGVSIEARPFAG